MADSLFTTDTGRRRLETEILPAWLPRQRWFGAKAKTVHSLRIVRQAALGAAWLFALEVTYADQSSETYLLPLTIAASREEAIAPLPDGRALIDATHEAEFRAGLFRLMAAGETREGLHGEAGVFLEKTFPAGEGPPSRVLHAEQSNTSLIYGERLFAKLYRRLVSGVNPDAELTRHLSECCGFQHVPAFGGAIEWDGASVALATALVPNDGDAWAAARKEIAAATGNVADRVRLEAQCLAFDPRKPGEGSLAGTALLGRRTGELHLALARPETPAAFAPEPFTADDAAALAGAVLDAAHEIFDLLAAQRTQLATVDAVLAYQLLDQREALRDWVAGAARSACGIKTRIHGDYHLGQVIRSGGDFLILDFEGEPLRTLAERRAKDSPLRDVAGMLRSFEYAALAPAGSEGSESPAGNQEPESWRTLWVATHRHAFLEGWKQATSGNQALLGVAQNGWPLLSLFLLQKALYEVKYEVNNRPSWVGIPLRGVLAAISEAPGPRGSG